MSGVLNKLFVYGTLLRGEVRSCYMHDCALTKILQVPGRLYDTGRGYPAALLDPGSEATISGELYTMQDPRSKIEELDRVEGTESGLFRRSKLNHSGIEFYCYEAGQILTDSAVEDSLIHGGNWRTHSSLALSDPVEFALRFEAHIKKGYKTLPDIETDGIHYIMGNVPIIVTAPHATAHVRLGKLKRQEFYTGALAVLLHSLTGCHVLYTDRLSEDDPNYTDDAPFKRKLSELSCGSGFGFMIDLHGTGSERPGEVFPGIGGDGEFLLGRRSALDELRLSAESNGMLLGSEDVFPAARQKTVTRFAATTLGVPAMQIEINQDMRRPESTPADFLRLVNFLKEFIGRLS